MLAILTREIKNYLKRPLFWLGIVIVILGVYSQVSFYFSIRYLSPGETIVNDYPETIHAADPNEGYIPATPEERRAFWEADIQKTLVTPGFGLSSAEAAAVIDEMKDLSIYDACRYFDENYNFVGSARTYELTKYRKGTSEEINAYLAEVLSEKSFSWYFSRKFADFAGLYMGFFATIMLSVLFMQDELQEEYLVVVNYDVKSFGDLYRLKFKLQRVDEELCKAQKEMYRDRAFQKRSCKTVDEVTIFEAYEDDYRDSLEQIKIQKKENHKKLQAVERCLERDGSMTDAELEYRIPVGDMEDLTEVARDEVPRNPQRVCDEEVTEEMISEAAVGEFFDIGIVDPDLRKRNIPKYESAKLPSNKADYMRMSVAEKVRCYPFDIKGTDLAFEMVKTYFETVGLAIDFHTVYEEAKLLTDYYEEQKAEEFLQERVERIIGTMELLGIDADRLTAYSADVLSEVFGFGDMDYFNGIKLFNKVIDRLGADIDQQSRYEMFDRIYEGGMQKRDYKHNRYIR